MWANFEFLYSALGDSARWWFHKSTCLQNWSLLLLNWLCKILNQNERNGFSTNWQVKRISSRSANRPTNQQQSNQQIAELLNVIDLLNDRISILETRCKELESQLADCDVQLETETRNLKRQLNYGQREQVIDAVENWVTAAKVSREFTVNPKTVYNIVKSQTIFRKKYDNSSRFLLI